MSIFRTGLRLTFALAMYAGLAHSVGRSWSSVINSPVTTFAVVIKPPRKRLSQRRGPLPKLLWADLFSCATKLYWINFLQRATMLRAVLAI